MPLDTRSSRPSMLDPERLEMAPAGTQRGELIATVPLAAPLEETTVTHKEWSVTSREFASIVTNSLESYSETLVRCSRPAPGRRGGARTTTGCGRG
ncbi:hypothetical protein OHV13_29725 [Kitasatospora purpeofusca]|uniref:hypothetical protein n=1 Tax=Kitasatospora purpeofusca TaxID=67352 RepID=UPI003253E8C4